MEGGLSLERADDVTVRRVRLEDAAAVAALVGQLGYERTEEEVRRWIGRPEERWHGQAAFVACRGAEVVGWAEVWIVEPLQRSAHGLLGGLVVKDGVRGTGIGRLLREHAEKWAWGQGVDEMVVTSRSTRSAAHRFYLRDGYRHVKTSEVFIKESASAAEQSDC